MTASADLRVLFRAPAGPRRGFGHLVRCRSLARALGAHPLLAIRGGDRARAAARTLGFELVAGSAASAIGRVTPDVLVVDDPIAAAARRWIACARRNGVRVVTVHDLGLGAAEGDLVVDGSVVRAATWGGWGGSKDPRPRERSPRVLRGPRFAILDPAFSSLHRAARHGFAPRVLIALGGGPRAALASAIACAVRQQLPWTRIRIAGGFAPALPADRGHIEWTGPLDGLAAELSACDVAVVGGGVSLYEACARGVAAVAVPVVGPQRPTVRGFVTRHAARGTWRAFDADGVAREVVHLLRRPDVRVQLAARGRQLVDGGGAIRVADAVRQLARGRRRAGTAFRHEVPQAIRRVS
jgi:spore coat polysaccharide biosynthesis predicted glycosyltransferase SpsG